MRRKRKQKAGAAKVAPVAGAAGLAATGVWRFLQRRRGAGGGAVAPEDAPSAKRDWTCECGQQFRVSGEDRHRVFWLADADEGDPVLGDQCPSCEKPLSTQEAA